MSAVYHSARHPGELPLGLVLIRAQAQPVALAFIGVFVVTLAAVLQGQAVLGALLWAVPIAYLLAVGYTVYDLHRAPAAVVLRGGFGAVVSVWDVARAREGAPERVRLQPVFRPFRKDGETHVGIGDAVLTVRPAEWPDYGSLLDALRAAADELDALAAGP